MNVTWNHVFYAVFGILTLLSTPLPPEVLDVLPTKWKSAIGVISVLAMYIRGHMNLFINPDGTPAQSTWTPKQDEKPPATTK